MYHTLTQISTSGSRSAWVVEGADRETTDRVATAIGRTALEQSVGSGVFLVCCNNRRDVEALRVEVDRLNSDSGLSAADSSDLEQIKQGQQGVRRVCVEAGSVQVGDQVGGNTVTGLGKIWRANADSSSIHGVSPAADHVQYAYFN